MEKQAAGTAPVTHKIRDIFVDGPIQPGFVGDSIAKHAAKKEIGGHSIFMGQVRNDVINQKAVVAIEYTAYRDMALEQMHQIREDIFAKYPLSCMHVYHSLGIVPAGELCLFVFTSSAHRKPAMDACNELVERIKAELPIWGKEILDDESMEWKKNL